ncbi:unnamed protein product [Sphacelaria rigidula]
MTLYVDDFLLTGASTKVLAHLRKLLQPRFALNDLGQASFVSGMAVHHEKEESTIRISQDSYTKSVLTRFGMGKSKPVSTPGVGKEFPRQSIGATYLDEEGTTRYQEIVGLLICIVQCTRYDIAYSVQYLTRFMSKPATVHMEAAKRVLRYLRDQTAFKLKYKTGNFNLHGFCDANHAAETERGRSCSGIIFFLAGAPISFASSLQKTAAQSTMEAELSALSFASREAIYLSGLLSEIGFRHLQLPEIWCDNLSALHVAANNSFSALGKHVALKYHRLKDWMVGL